MPRVSAETKRQYLSIYLIHLSIYEYLCFYTSVTQLRVVKKSHTLIQHSTKEKHRSR